MKEEQQKIINVLREMYGIHAIWLWGPENIRLQYEKNHLEFVEFSELIPKITSHFENESIRRELIPIFQILI
jgi:hypothetical protein